MSAVSKVVCICGELLSPKRGWLTSPKDVTCTRCSFKIRLDVDPPPSAEACFSKAEQAIESSDNDRAIGLTSIGLATERGAPLGHFLRAFALGDTGKSILDWTACIDAGYRPAGATWKRAKARNADKDYSGALADYDRVLESPDFAADNEIASKFCRIVMERAVVLCDAGDFTRALSDCDRLLDGDLRSRREREQVTKYAVLQARGIAYCRAGQFEAARSDLAEVLPYSGGTANYWLLVCKYRGDEARATSEWSKQ